MPIYVIKETKPAWNIWTYEVEADNEEEALETVMEGDVDPVNYETVDDHFNADDPEYDITEKNI